MSEDQPAQEASANTQARAVFVIVVGLVALVGGALGLQHALGADERREEQERVDELACAIAVDEGRRVTPQCLDFVCDLELSRGLEPVHCS